MSIDPDKLRIAKSRAWVNAQLEGTGITLTARR